MPISLAWIIQKINRTISTEIILKLMKYFTQSSKNHLIKYSVWYDQDFNCD
jgi:hypothetical protein